MAVRATAHRAEVLYLLPEPGTVRCTAHRAEVLYAAAQSEMSLENETGARAEQSGLVDGRSDLLNTLVYRR